jgi:hypothetical protein
MKNVHNWKSSHDYLKALVLPFIIFAGLLLFLIVGTGKTASVATSENLHFLETAVLKATVQCYAIEGMYPPDVAYLEAHYGILIDKDNYIVHYEVFASNILPDITVLQKQ